MLSEIISFSSPSDRRLLNFIFISDSDVFSTDAKFRHPVICSSELWNFLPKSEILSRCQSVLDNRFLVDRLARIPARRKTQVYQCRVRIQTSCWPIRKMEEYIRAGSRHCLWCCGKNTIMFLFNVPGGNTFLNLGISVRG